jgi:peroxiredoxin
LGQLQKDLKKIQAAGIQVVGISFDSVEILKGYSDKTSIEFLLLSDKGSETIKAYGIHNKGGLPHPGTFLVDKTGTVRAKLFIDGYKERHANDELIAAGKKIH